jgi:Ser/Thr protein kinase RdoA (MazF antagonist)
VVKDTRKKYLEHAAVKYGTQAKQFIPLSDGFQNEVYEFMKYEKKYILRITSGKKKSKDLIQNELSLVCFLKNKGISVSEAIPSLEGSLLEEIQQDQESLYCALFVKAEGAPVNVQDHAQWNEEFFYEWGRLLGRVHHVSKNLETAAQHVKWPQWSNEHPYNYELFKNLNTELEKEKYEDIVALLKGLPRDERHFGLIHNDFHQGNFFVKDGNITLFDFDDCLYFWYAYDIATAFYHAFWQNTSFNGGDNRFCEAFLIPFLSGYSKENTLTHDMINQIPLFLKLRELFLYALFQKVWVTNVREEWQNFTIQNLKKNIENDAVYAGLDNKKLKSIKQQFMVQ